MRRTIAVLLAFLAVPLFATQANPSAKQKQLIDELIVLTHLDDTMRSIMDAMLVQMQKQMGPTNAEDTKDFERYRELLREKMNYNELVRELYEPIYAKYFNEQELADIVAFYKTPTGQKMMKVTPQLVQDSMEAASGKMQQQIQTLLSQVQDERKKRLPWEQTMRDIRTIATATEAYATDENKYPAAATMEELRKVLEPTYVKTLPMKDGWGNEYAYVVSEDREHYRIVSAGADNAFEWDSRRIVVKPVKSGATEEPEPVKLSDRLADDIIYADGAFVQIPRQAQEKYQ